MRGTRVKALRKEYVMWLDLVMRTVKIPEGSRPISFRVWRRRRFNVI